MTPKPPKGIAARRAPPAPAPDGGIPRALVALKNAGIGSGWARWTLRALEQAQAELERTKRERDSYREQVKALLEKVAAVQKCDHGGES